MQNFASGSDQVVERYRASLDGLRRDFLERTAITTKICVLQITDRVERGFNQLSDQVWDLGRHLAPLGNGYPLNEIWKMLHACFTIYRMVKARTSILPYVAWQTHVSTFLTRSSLG